MDYLGKLKIDHFVLFQTRHHLYPRGKMKNIRITQRGTKYTLSYFLKMVAKKLIPFELSSTEVFEGMSILIV